MEQQPLRALDETLIRNLAERMNQNQVLAAALMPRFALEIRVEGEQFQVQANELNTGHDIRLARDVAAGIQETMRRLVEQIDAHLAAQGEAPRPAPEVA